MLIRPLISVLFVLAAVMQLCAQKPKELFRSDSILEISLELPIKDVVNDTKERRKHDAKLYYIQPDGSRVEHAIKVKVRGKTRALKQTCSFPPLEISFNKTDSRNSVFEDQTKIKLVTHCMNDDEYEEYVQKEYVVYKMYEKISPYSFNTRLFKINYVDSNNPKRKNMHYGFFIERLKDVAERNDMRVLKDSIRIQEVVNQEDLDKLVMFEFMIGNLDWSIPKLHNMKLIIGDKGSLPIAVPYDFDYSGMVDTPYALPPEESNFADVKTRHFRGFCRQDGYKSTIDFYLAYENDLLNEIETAEYLRDQTKKTMTKYMNSFYKNLKDPKYVDKKISKACRVKHKHAYEK